MSIGENDQKRTAPITTSTKTNNNNTKQTRKEQKTMPSSMCEILLCQWTNPNTCDESSSLTQKLLLCFSNCASGVCVCVCVWVLHESLRTIVFAIYMNFGIITHVYFWISYQIRDESTRWTECRSKSYWAESIYYSRMTNEINTKLMSIDFSKNKFRHKYNNFDGKFTEKQLNYLNGLVFSAIQLMDGINLWTGYLDRMRSLAPPPINRSIVCTPITSIR